MNRDDPPTYRSLIARSVQHLINAGIDGARLDVEVLLMHLLDLDRAHLYLTLADEPSPETERALAELVNRRALGEPVAYITGHREFMGLDFLVDSRALIPRPETEGLVERAVRWLEQNPSAERIVDVGTGSGAIAVSIDRLLPREKPVTIVGSDISFEALEVARQNQARLKADRVNLVQGDLLAWCGGTLDLIVANLPYLREEQRHSGIAQEPSLALYASERGFALYSALIPPAAGLLSPTGALMCEIDPDQREQALAAAEQTSPSADIKIEKDLSGRDRYLIVEMSV